MRLDQYLSLAGFGSRSEVRKLIKSGRVHVNGVIQKHDYHIDGDVFVDGVLVVYEMYRYYMLNKPKGYITATKDLNHQTVSSLIDDEVSFVGRLDKDTEGLLFATNDGELLHRLTSPKYAVEKTYYVELNDVFKDTYVPMIEAGLKISKTHFLPAKVEINTPTSIYLTIIEGKYHQVKRMMAYFNLEVIYLKRISFGSIKLDETLKPGAYRRLKADELAILKGLVYK